MFLNSVSFASEETSNIWLWMTERYILIYWFVFCSIKVFMVAYKPFRYSVVLLHHSSEKHIWIGLCTWSYNLMYSNNTSARQITEVILLTIWLLTYPLENCYKRLTRSVRTPSWKIQRFLVILHLLSQNWGRFLCWMIRDCWKL
jgi:hypothetical protein